jgi:phosphate transport system permease protein
MAQAALGLESRGLSGDPKRRRKEIIVRNLFKITGIVSIVISALIVASLIGRAISFLTEIDLSWLMSDGWFPRENQYGLPTIIVGTLVISIIAMFVAGPLGLGAAIYLSEYANPRLRKVLKPILEILAGIPSVVLGVFALQFISPELVQRLFTSANLFNGLAAGVAVGVLVTPLVASVSEDALRAVPSALREASYGLGARKMTTTLRIVVPAAISGIVAALILGISRAIGETMVVTIAAGATGGSLFTFNPLEQMQTMTAAMAALATGGDQVKGSVSAVDSLYFVGVLLFLMTLGLNLLSERFVRRVRKRY